MSVISSTSSRFPLGLGLLIFLLLFFLITSKYECTLPRVAVITNPDPRPPGSGCNENDRLSAFAKKFSRPEVAERAIYNLLKKQDGNSKRRVFYVKDIVSLTVKDGKVNLDAIKYLASNYQIGLSFLTELFTNLISCGYLDAKTPRPNFEEILKQVKPQKPSFPRTPKEPAPPKTKGSTDDVDDMWWLW